MMCPSFCDDLLYWMEERLTITRTTRSGRGLGTLILVVLICLCDSNEE